MSKIYTGEQDERTIEAILAKGLEVKTKPKWVVLRLALACSLKNTDPPDRGLDSIQDRINGSEYSLAQVSGAGQEKNFTDTYRAMLSVYHNTDLFSDEDTFRKLLQRHIRRGLREFRTSWLESHDFHEYLFQEFLSDMVGESKEDKGNEQLIESALAEIGVVCRVNDILQGPRITRYKVTLNHVNDLDKLKKGLEKLSFILGLKQKGIFLNYSDTPMLIGLDIPRPSSSWKNIGAERIRDWTGETKKECILPVCAGVNVEGKPHIFDLTAAPHLFVAGTTGSGKSVCLHSIILSLINHQHQDIMKFCLIDPKKVEFSYYKNLPNLYGEQVLFDQNETLTALTKLLKEMEGREKRLSEAGVRDLIEFQERFPESNDLPRIIVIVEEVADLLLQSKPIEQLLIRLAQKGRASGIHLILATQRPDAETFSGLLRSNIPSRIALTVQKTSESRIILDETGAEKLTGRGDGLIKFIGEKTIRIHGLNIKPADIKIFLDTLRSR